MTRILALIATIPPRRASCERLLRELGRQSQVPDGVILCLDGYGDAPAPACALPVLGTYRTAVLSGPGARWRVAVDLDPQDLLIALDDDAMLVQAPHLVRALVAAAEQGGGAAAAMGRSADGKRAAPGDYSRGPLVHGCGCGLALRVRHLEGLQELATEVQAGGGLDPLGPLGDDDALVSALLWRNKIPLLHAATGNVFAAPETRQSSQLVARQKAGQRDLDSQKRAIRKITGWPWPEPR